MWLHIYSTVVSQSYRIFEPESTSFETPTHLIIGRVENRSTSDLRDKEYRSSTFFFAVTSTTLL